MKSPLLHRYKLHEKSDPADSTLRNLTIYNEYSV
jgi:hypothetical protein